MKRVKIKYYDKETKSYKEEHIFLTDNEYHIMKKNAALQEKNYKHTNRKGKEWRDELYELGKKEFEQNKYLDKTKSLKAAFEKLPDKEQHRKEFDLKFSSICQTFRKKV